MACGIFTSSCRSLAVADGFSSCASWTSQSPDQGLTPYSLRCEINSQPLDHQGSPTSLGIADICDWIALGCGASLVAQLVEEPACSARDLGSIPGSGSSPGEGISCLSQYSWASLVGQMVKNPPARWKACVRSLIWKNPPGEGNGNPLQYSCLESPMDRGAWRATVLGGHRGSALGCGVSCISQDG